MLPTGYRSAVARIEPGEVLLGYSDGVPEAMSPDDVQYTQERFFSLLEKPASSHQPVHRN